MSKLILYRATDWLAAFNLRIYAESELDPGAICKKNLQVLSGKRQVIRGLEKIAGTE